MSAEDTEKKRAAIALKASQEEGRVRAIYQKVFGTKDGEFVLAHMSAAAGLEEPVFQLVQKDGHWGYCPINAALNDGSRVVIRRIKAILARKPGAEEEKPKPKVRK